MLNEGINIEGSMIYFVLAVVAIFAITSGIKVWKRIISRKR